MNNILRRFYYSITVIFYRMAVILLKVFYGTAVILLKILFPLRYLVILARVSPKLLSLIPALLHLFSLSSKIVLLKTFVKIITYWILVIVPAYSVFSIYLLSVANLDFSILNISHIFGICLGVVGSLGITSLFIKYERKKNEIAPILENYEQSKLLVSFALPVLSLILILLYLENALPGLLSIEISLLELASTILAIVVAISSPNFIVVYLSKDVMFAIAKEYSKRIQHKSGRIDKMSYLLKALKAYNSFLLGKLGGQIDEYSILSNLIPKYIKEGEQTVSSFSDSFDENDKLKPLLFLSRVIEDTPEQRDVLVSQNIYDRLKETITVVIPSLLVAISGLLISSGQ